MSTTIKRSACLTRRTTNNSMEPFKAKMKKQRRIRALEALVKANIARPEIEFF